MDPILNKDDIFTGERIQKIKEKVEDHNSIRASKLENALEKTKLNLNNSYTKLVVLWNKNYDSEEKSLNVKDIEEWSLERKQIAFAIKKAKTEIDKTNDLIIKIRQTCKVNEWKNKHNDFSKQAWEQRCIANDITKFTKTLWIEDFNAIKTLEIKETHKYFRELMSESRYSISANKVKKFYEIGYQFDRVISSLDGLHTNIEKYLLQLYSEEPALPSKAWTPRNDGNANYNIDDNPNLDVECPPYGFADWVVKKNEVKAIEKHLPYKAYEPFSLSFLNGVSESFVLSIKNEDELKMIESIDMTEIDYERECKISNFESRTIKGETKIIDNDQKAIINMFQKELREFTYEIKQEIIESGKYDLFLDSPSEHNHLF